MNIIFYEFDHIDQPVGIQTSRNIKFFIVNKISVL